jgi:hypothetical protein
VFCGLAIGLPGALAAMPPPAYDHVVLAIFENKRQSQIIGSSDAPYLTGLAAQGANFTQSFALRHPSQPNYLDLFSGSNQGVTDNTCPHTFASGNLGQQVIASGRTFVGYAENLPSAGSDVCNADGTLYARRHVPWANFSNLHQATVSRPYSEFPTDFTRLPTVSWVVPNNCNNMHDCSVSTGDAWARRNLDAYAQWAKTHNSLLIVTWDEDDNCGAGCVNHIATFFVGAHIIPGKYSERIDHFTVLRTIETMYGLPALGSAAHRSPITDAFGTAPPTPPSPPHPPTPPSPPSPPPSPPLTTITGVTQSNSRWRAGNRLATYSRAKRPPVGTTFRFVLNQRATVSFAFTQQVGGRKVRGKCVAQTNSNRRSPPCKRTVTQGTLTFTGRSGLNRVAFQGPISRSKKLPLGAYKLEITALNSAGKRSPARTLSFTIVK